MRFVWPLFFWGLALYGKLTVVTTTEELSSLVSTLGGEKVSVTYLARGTQDPHYVEAKPSFLVKIIQADLLVCNGLALETGWLPLLLQKARRPHLLPGGKGFFEAAEAVEPIEVNPAAERSDGDVHPQGNPHFFLDPERTLAVTQRMALKLGTLDSSNSAFYNAQQAAFEKTVRARLVEWKKKMATLKGSRVVGYHRTFNYLFRYFGMEPVGFLEPKPGIPPTASHTLDLIQTVKAQKAKTIAMENYFDPKPGMMLAEKTGARLVVLPPAIGSDSQSQDYLKWYDSIIALLSGEKK